MNIAEKIIEILEKNSIKQVFGIPGEQILPLYQALQKSSIKHILVRHEQSAAHACDGYYRSSGKFAVCVTTASPGALNLVMAVSTAFKDNIPMLIITGDNIVENKFKNYFQSFPLHKVFQNITFKSYDPQDAIQAISNLEEALFLLKNNPQGPIHINLSKDILLEKNNHNHLCIDYKTSFENKNYLIDSDRLLFIVGAGAISQTDLIYKIAIGNNIPLATTFHAKGIIDEKNNINLGLIGNRGSRRSQYAFQNADCIIALGTRLSERTIKNIDKRIIQININHHHLLTEKSICTTVENFLNNTQFKNYHSWLEEILKIKETQTIEGVSDKNTPLRPPSAISTILNNFPDNIIVSDAGSHTTWTTLLKKSDSYGKLLFSGGLAPMGYGLPAAIGASIATDNKIILINGDGDFQMNIQELATIKQYNLNIMIFILNNSQYGIIRQNQKNVYNMDPYEVYLENPDFVKLANSYQIQSLRVQTKDKLDKICKKLDGPCVVDIPVGYEDIPMP